MPIAARERIGAVDLIDEAPATTNLEISPKKEITLFLNKNNSNIDQIADQMMVKVCASNTEWPRSATANAVI